MIILSLCQFILRCVFIAQKKQNVLLPNCVSVRATANKTFASTAFIIMIIVGHHITSIYLREHIYY